MDATFEALATQQARGSTWVALPSMDMMRSPTRSCWRAGPCSASCGRKMEGEEEEGDDEDDEVSKEEN